MSAIKLTDDAFEAQVINADTPVLVDFFAEWCGPCKALAPTLDELASDYEGKARIAKINVDENNQMAAKYGIRSIPAVIIFNNGEEVERLTGNNPKAKYQEALDKLL